MLDLFDLVAHVHPPTSARIESLTEHSKGRPIGVLVTLVEAYEQKHYRIDPPDPIEAIKFRVEQLELKPSAWRISSGRIRVSETWLDGCIVTTLGVSTARPLASRADRPCPVRPPEMSLGRLVTSRAGLPDEACRSARVRPSAQ